MGLVRLVNYLWTFFFFCKLSNIVYKTCVEKSRKLYVKENLNVQRIVKTVLGEYF